jgi:hypothetical protein
MAASSALVDFKEVTEIQFPAINGKARSSGWFSLAFIEEDLNGSAF